jgi:CubicO group peptidase (beta-lactamase class C family)
MTAGSSCLRAWAVAEQWPAASWSAAIVWRDATGATSIETRGDTSHQQRIASVSKPLTAWAVLVAVEEGSVSLDDPVGQEGCTLRHLLCHAGGYPFEGAQPVGKPGAKRIYSNSGYDLIAAHMEASTDMAIADYLGEAVFSPLGMDSSELRGSCAKDVWSSVDDLVAFTHELRSPSLISRETWLEAVTTQMPALSGVVPGIGSFDPCPWGLGPEIRGHKIPHWTGTRNSAATFGHFGGVGTFLWVDPVADVACVMLSETEFDTWGLDHWPPFSDAVLTDLGR